MQPELRNVAACTMNILAHCYSPVAQPPFAYDDFAEAISPEDYKKMIDKERTPDELLRLKFEGS